MQVRLRLVFPTLLLIASVATAGDDKNTPLPDYVLKARTVLVMIDPEAGTSMTTPQANKTAQDDVEKALSKWGRFSPVIAGADLIITVRKGNGKIVQRTIGGEPTNDRPVIVQPNDNGIRIAVQQGRPPDTPQTLPQDSKPHQQTEMTPPDDVFAVYDGVGGVHLEDPPVWRYTAKNALRSPDVPAVAEFRKVVEAALKQQKKKP